MNIVPFDFKGNSVRTVQIHGEPWFVAKDVCSVLELSNPSMAIKALDEDEVTLSQIEGSHRPTNIISESGLYALIMRSDKPQAKPFRKWVTSEVIPSIRKTGKYEAPAATHNSEPQLRVHQAREMRLQTKMFMSIGKEIGLTGNQLVLSASQAVQKVIGVAPLGVMGITHIEAPTNEALLTPTDIGKELGFSAQRVNMMLKSDDLQTSFRNSKSALVYEATEKGKELGAVMQDTGKRHGDGTPIRQLKWPSSIVDHLRSAGAA